ncbi:hypothetical protein CASFOL_002243 [Castilleja foliolosa]|uniref:Uncharacterized protein n=1 Tax=Castilleja foliolosa TaxID=1961234 RepID=A0ABD3EDY9_9LAMI
MAKTLMLKLTTLISLLIFLLLALHSKTAISFEDDENEDDEYVIDSVFSNNVNGIRKSRFLASSVKKIKSGTQCNAKAKKNVCNGVSADKGVSKFYCCKTHCRDVLGDRNNCGKCGQKCRLNERCCGGVCTDVSRNKANCGKCGKKCRKGVKCEYGYCGYA